MSEEIIDHNAKRLETTIEDEGDGKYSLYVGGSRVVHIGPTYMNPNSRMCHWAVYGPLDIDQSIAIMKGFLHLTALLGNENRANTNPPATSEKDSSSTEGKRKWQTSKTTRRSKNS